MARRPRDEWFQAGGSSGGDAGDKWELKTLYRSLAAAYHWTYSQIDEHTLAEVNELLEGWEEHTPTNILVKALVEGFGGKTVKSTKEETGVPPEAQAAMQRSAVDAIAAKADSRWLPVQIGKDRGLPEAPPVFDVAELRQRNIEILRKRVVKAKPSVRD